MTFASAWLLQQAVYARLAAVLAGQGPSGADVSVFDHVPANPARLHCRIDGFTATQRNIKTDKTLQGFNVHFFNRPTTETASSLGFRSVRLLQAIAVDALHEWTPGVSGAASVRHIESFVARDEDGITQHAMSRFEIYMSPQSITAGDVLILETGDGLLLETGDGLLLEA